MNVRKDVRIQSVPAEQIIGFAANARTMLFDPERPTVDPNQLLQELGGRMNDPRAVSHSCPFCDCVMQWELFRAHIKGCVTKWYKLTDPSLRSFAGATPGGSQDE